jgi:GNAT superfamily N-acetyltransferase
MPSRADSTTILNDGREMALRLLGPDDEPAAAAMVRGLDPREIAHLDQDLADEEVRRRWLEEASFGRRRVLGALDPAAEGRLGGYCSLEQGQGAHRHMGRVETFLHPAYRELGLGSNLLKEVAARATREELVLLQVEIHAERRALVRAYKNLGFELKAIIESYRVDPAGEPYDVIIMLHRLVHVSNKDFLYRY